MANDGIVNQRAVLAYARESFGMIGAGSWSQVSEGAVGKLRRSRRFTIKAVMCCPCPRIRHQEILTRVIWQRGVRVENRVMATRILLDEGRAVGAMGINVRTEIRRDQARRSSGLRGVRKAGLAASGYLMGTL